MTYQNYHKHSWYSNTIISDSTVSPEDYAKRAVELGHGILSGVEHGWQGRYIEPYELAKQYNLKFLFGTEAYFVKNRLEKDDTNSHIILLAKNENGRKNINRILSEANVSGFYYRPRIDLELLYSLPKDDIWITSACIAGWKYDDADAIWLEISNHFGKNFFLEVQNHNTATQIGLNARIVDIANKNNINMIYGCDSHYIHPEQSKDRDDYLVSKHINYEDEIGWVMDYANDATAHQRFVDQGVLSLAQIKEAMDNTNIFLQVEEYKSDVFTTTLKLPSLYPEKSQEEKDKIFEDLIWEKWNEEKINVPEVSWQKYEKEIKKELAIVIETKIADYFLIDYNVIKRGKELGGFITMTGRGSAPSFYLSKLLGFTTIDRIDAPVKLFPERFITKERILDAGSLPDIDFNLGNPEIFLQAQSEIMGENHSYPMLAFGTLRPKAAWKLYARAKDIDFETANRISDQITKFENAIKHTENDDERLEIDVMDYIEKGYQETYNDSTKYLGIVSDFKIHACGSLLYDKNIKEEIGIIKIKENICCCMDGLWAEKYSFLKNDLLKVSTVDLIYKVYQRIGVQPHSLPELIKICEGNKKVWDIYANAYTIAINQFEGNNAGSKAAKYKPKNISEACAFVASIRPGFQSNYKQFESREPFSYGIPSLDDLIQTKDFPFSFMLYQENSMQVLAYAGIPISQTYEIVKNIAKKRVDKVLKYKEKFTKGMTKKIMQDENRNQNEAESIANKTWKIIEDSSRYSFNASHAYSVAGDSLYEAYLKSHYPLEFYEVLLQMLESDGDKDRLADAKDEAERAFKIIFPPYKFGQDNRKIVANKETNEILSSISSIKGFGAAIGENMYQMSQNKFDTFVDFLIYAEENKMATSKISDLIKINYFADFGNNKKLQAFYEEFTKGKSRYNKTLSDKSKEKRIPELKEIFNSLPNERFPIWQQIDAENGILGYVQATYPVDKHYIYVMKLDEKFAPRIQAYCIANGKQMSLKIQKKVFENNNFLAGSILYVKHFEKKPSVTFVDGKFVESETDFTWWLSNFSEISPEDFDKTIREL